MANVSITYVSIGVPKPAAYNPRKISPEAFAQLKESISRFQLVDPLILNSAPKRKNVLIGGHMRLRAAKELGHKTIPVVYLNIPDIEREKELNLRLHKNTGEFDFDLLQKIDLDLLESVGFDKDALNDIWSEHLKAKDDSFNVEKELKKIRKPQTRLGDLILLGEHKLLCGDSTKPENLKRLFGDEKAAMIYSDPKYNIKLDYDRGIGGKARYGGHVDDNMPDEEYKKFLKQSMEAALAVTRDNAHVFYWCDQTYIWLIQTLYRELGLLNRRVCIWLKNSQNPVPSVAFNKCYEPAVYATRGKPYLAKKLTKLNEVLNADMTTGNNLLSESLDHLDVWMVNRLPGKEYEHSTSKPPALHEKAIRRCTKPGDIILDSFSGSGSTIIAGEQLKRRVYAVELEPIFCDLTIKRYEQLTGIKAKIIRANEKV
jgi:DNA modification methylase